MKKLLLATLLVPTLAFADHHGATPHANGMNEPQMQEMMKQMQKVEACMTTVDQTAIENLGERAQKLEQTFIKLCQEGKRDAAQQKLVSFAKDVNNHGEIKKMRQCFAKIDNPMLRQSMTEKFEINTDQQICDSIPVAQR